MLQREKWKPRLVIVAWNHISLSEIFKKQNVLMIYAPDKLKKNIIFHNGQLFLKQALCFILSESEINL